MKAKLGDVAKINFGPYEKGESKGDAKYLLASHFDASYQPSNFELSYTHMNDGNRYTLLKDNDVILAGKGQRTFAWAYDPHMGPCIPSSLFFVLRTNPSQINGKFLAHYLNSERIQHKLTLLGAGLTVPSIPKKELQKLTVYIPTMEEQLKFVELADLLQKDVSLVKSLLSKKQALNKTILNTVMNNQIIKEET